MSTVLFHEPVFATIVEPGDRLFFFELGTTNDLTVFLDAAGLTPAPQPLVADASGRFRPIYLDTQGNPPKVVLEDSDGAQKWTTDEYPLSDVSAVQAQVDQIQLDLDAVEGTVVNLESSDQQQDASIADHETRITDLENEPDPDPGLSEERARVSLGGDFGSGEVVLTKLANTVTMTSDGTLTHNSLQVAQSFDNVIPSQFRPSTQPISAVYHNESLSGDNGRVAQVEVTDTGLVRTRYANANAGTNSAERNDTISPFTISWVITDNIV